MGWWKNGELTIMKNLGSTGIFILPTELNYNNEFMKPPPCENPMRPSKGPSFSM